MSIYRNPDEMTADERLREVGRLLATAALRLSPPAARRPGIPGIPGASPNPSTTDLIDVAESGSVSLTEGEPSP